MWVLLKTGPVGKFGGYNGMLPFAGQHKPGWSCQGHWRAGRGYSTGEATGGPAWSHVPL